MRYVNIEQAKALKVNGFYMMVKSSYVDGENGIYVQSYHSPANYNHTNSNDNEYSRPSIEEVIDWFKSENRLVLTIDISINTEWTFSVYEIEESGNYAKQLCFEYTFQKDRSVAESMCIDWAIKYLSANV